MEVAERRPSKRQGLETRRGVHSVFTPGGAERADDEWRELIRREISEWAETCAWLQLIQSLMSQRLLVQFSWGVECGIRRRFSLKARRLSFTSVTGPVDRESQRAPAGSRGLGPIRQASRGGHRGPDGLLLAGLGVHF
jgi:hypothetical protein